MTILSSYIGSVPTDRARTQRPLWRRALSRLCALDLLARERTYMDRLDDRTLRDIGLTRADIDGALVRPKDHLRSILLRGPH